MPLVDGEEGKLSHIAKVTECLLVLSHAAVDFIVCPCSTMQGKQNASPHCFRNSLASSLPSHTALGWQVMKTRKEMSPHSQGSCPVLTASSLYSSTFIASPWRSENVWGLTWLPKQCKEATWTFSSLLLHHFPQIAQKVGCFLKENKAFLKNYLPSSPL